MMRPSAGARQRNALRSPLPVTIRSPGGPGRRARRAAGDPRFAV